MSFSFSPQASSGKGSFRKEVLMVDPLEAKKIADKQMVVIKTEERYEVRNFQSLNLFAAQLVLLSFATDMLKLNLGKLSPAKPLRIKRSEVLSHAVLCFPPFLFTSEDSITVLS